MTGDYDILYRNTLNSYLTYLWGFILFVSATLIFMMTGRTVGVSKQLLIFYSIGAALTPTLSQKIYGHYVVSFLFYLVFLILIKRKQYLKFNKGYLYFLIYWSLFPLIAGIIMPDLNSNFYWYGDLRGFAYDRVEYAFVVGLSIYVLAIRTDISRFFKFFAFLSLAVVLMLANTRFVFLALFTAFLVNYGFSKKGLFTLVLTVVAFLLLLIFVREDPFVSGRIEIISMTADYLSRNPHVLIFGKGTMYTDLGAGIVPHNFILQTVLNFGLLGLFLYTIFLLHIYYKLPRTGRGLMSYILTYGMFHPGLDAFMVQPLIGLSLLMSLPLCKPSFITSPNLARRDIGMAI